ncbi:MAG: hypothetical protein M0R77_01090 [Gammaproteobacteria bacterium]|nr:hypothetical protein [Acholeplasmataceae bacterium]MCK9529151.1 hypothetical protein [Gammaproteobacteria bacterium]
MLNSTRSVQVYPRGFLGKPIDRVEEAPKFAMRSPNLMFGFSLVSGMNERRKGSPEVDELHQQYLGNLKYATNFDCFKDLLVEFLSVFTTNQFGQWLFMQRESPVYTPLHERFLIDTCNYLLTGQRKLSVYNWEGMFKHNYQPGSETYGGRHTETNVPLELNKTDRLLATDLFKRFENASLGDVFQYWVSKPNGLDDLMTSLFIFFGSSIDN